MSSFHYATHLFLVVYIILAVVSLLWIDSDPAICNPLRRVVLESQSPTVFTALHGMQTRSYDEISVRLSVCLSVCLSNACIVTKRKKDMF